MSWMTCTTCTKVVKANNTGICMDCQKGFARKEEPDQFIFPCCKDYYPELEEEKTTKSNAKALKVELAKEWLEELANLKERAPTEEAKNRWDTRCNMIAEYLNYLGG